MRIQDAIVYDIEVLPNVFTFDAEWLNGDGRKTWEISEFRDDSASFLEFLRYLNREKIPMIGFNSVRYDYPVIHEFWTDTTVRQDRFYAKSKAIINGSFANPWEHQVPHWKRLAPQIDLYKIHHFDNAAKSTSLKALQIVMRLDNVVESGLPFDRDLTNHEVQQELIPYNIHDVKSTKTFGGYSMDAINFRAGLIAEHSDEVMNYSDTKIGSIIMEARLGKEICYDTSGGMKEKRQTIRHRVVISDIIFDHVQFRSPEFQGVLDFLRQQTLTIDEATDSLKTKGVFTDLKVMFGGILFAFGTGGIHASVESQKFVADEEWLIRDIDVASLYPSIAIAYNLSPEHLGAIFPEKYSELITERRKHAKGTVENASLKLAANGTYGNSNNKYSVFFDPQYTMAITINGQLMLCMLAEWLVHKVPTIQLIQVNTDGITYRVHRDHEPRAAELCAYWEKYTRLVLEDADYSRMWIRDVNNYVAEYKGSGKLKQKGAYWHPDPNNYIESIAKAGPPAWHKNFSPTIVPMAVVAYMVWGVDPETYLRNHRNAFDFMLQIKVKRSDTLLVGDIKTQKNTRYYVSKNGQKMVKVSPPTSGSTLGEYKRAGGVSKATYDRVMATLPLRIDGSGLREHNPDIHTKNKSVYAERRTGVQSMWKVKVCNDASHFGFEDIDFDFYLQEIAKLIV